MSILDKIKNLLSGSGNNDPREAEFEKAVQDIWKEYTAQYPLYFIVTLSRSEYWKKIQQEWTDQQKTDCLVYLVLAHERYGRGHGHGPDPVYQLFLIRMAMIEGILRGKLQLSDENALKIYSAFRNNPKTSTNPLQRWPLTYFLNQVVKQRAGQTVSPELLKMAEDCKAELERNRQNFSEKDFRKLNEKLDILLFSAENTQSVKPELFQGEDALTGYANPQITAMPETEKQIWYQLLGLAKKSTGSKPTEKYLKETKLLIDKAEKGSVQKILADWLQFLTGLKEEVVETTINYGSGNYINREMVYLRPGNTEIMKGLVWLFLHFENETTIPLIAGLAERAYKKIPGQGPTAAAIGNACLYVMYKSKGLEGIGQLSRLRLRIKQLNTQALIDKYLKAAAEEQGVSVSEIEDMAVDDAGLVKGKRVFHFADYRAEMEIVSVNKVEQRWYKADGSQQKSVPAFVKEEHAAELKKFKAAVKLAEQTLTAQRDRLDIQLRYENKIPWEHFKQYYLQHGLLSFLAERIIWNVHTGEKSTAAVCLNGGWVNVQDEAVDIAGVESVSLWHPVQWTVEENRAWRNFFIRHEIQQPLKQAFREIYIVTDAERNTRIYSNRMAAHILRQHQFNSLAKGRGWRYALQGNFDNGGYGNAVLPLPEMQMQAEFWIDEVPQGENLSGIWTYVSTDQVRFKDLQSGQPVPMQDIPSRIFSEVIRDTDLFVGVASVGNDPNWRDSGELGNRYNEYWTRFSFGELSGIAVNRKELLTTLLPRLKIRHVAEIKGNFLVVKGKLRTYKIHIGSTNILMEPNDQYLCIVPDRSEKNNTGSLFLPFEGDTGFSILLSKAMLLAEDDKITDPVILNQLGKGN